MPKSVKIWFSKPHKSKSNNYDHIDVYRKSSDSSKTKKIDHNKITSQKVKINKDK